jgi:hypothetical protein
MSLDSTWVEGVRRWCDPVFSSANCGFEWNGSGYNSEAGGQVTAMLWEAVPDLFAERYPESDIIEQYGVEQWPPPCIDYWIYVDPVTHTAELSIEGWSYWPTPLPLSGDAEADGRMLATKFAEFLRVSPPAGPGS